MRKILLTLSVLFLYVSAAQAMLIPTNTESRAYNDGSWYSTNSSYVSPANRGGLAFRFVLDQAYNVSSIDGFVSGLGQGFSNESPANAQFSLYSGSSFGHDNAGPFPSNTVIYSSQNYSVPLDDQSRPYSEQTSLSLAPGEYWFGAQGGGGVMRVDGYALHGDLAQIHNPEPATLALVGGGLLAMFRRRRV